MPESVKEALEVETPSDTRVLNALLSDQFAGPGATEDGHRARHAQAARTSSQRRARWKTTDIIVVRAASVRRNGSNARLAGHHARGEGSRSRSAVQAKALSLPL